MSCGNSGRSVSRSEFLGHPRNENFRGKIGTNGVPTHLAPRNNLNIQNIQKLCDIFCPHTAHCLNRQQQTAGSFTKSVSFHSIRFEVVRRVLGTAFAVESAGEKCECFVRYG